MPFAPVLCAILISAADVDAEYKQYARQRAQVESLLRPPRGRSADLKEALDVLKEMQEALDRRDDGDWRLYVCWRRAWCNHNLGQFRQGRLALEKALDDEHAPKQPLIQFFMRRDLGEWYLRGRMFVRAKPHLEWTLAEAVKLNEKGGVRFKASEKVPFKVLEPELVRIRLLNAECLLCLGENDRAREALEPIHKTIQARLKEKRPPREREEWKRLAIQCQGDLSELERLKSNPVVGIMHLEQSLAELGKKDDAESARLEFGCRIGLAQNYWTIARFRDAEGELARAEKLLAGKKIYIDRFRDALIGARATLHFEETAYTIDQDLESGKILQRLDEADKLARKALGDELETFYKASDNLDFSTLTRIDLLGQIDELRGAVRAHKGETKAAAGHYQAALRAYDLVVKQYESMVGPRHDLTLQVRRRRARLNLLRGTVDAARKEAREAFGLFAKAHGPDDVGRGDFLQLLTTIESRAGNVEEAVRLADAHRKLSARRLVPYLASLTAPEQIKFFRMWDDPGLHAGLRLGIRDEALRKRSAEWLVNGKAKIAEVMAGVNHFSRDGEDHEALRRSIQRQGYLLHGWPDGKQESVQAELLKEEARQRELAGKRTFKPGKEWYSLTELREKLASDEVYVDVFCMRPDEKSPRAYHAWLIPREGTIAVVELGKAAEIDDLVKKFVAHQEDIVDVLRRLDDKPVKAEEELYKESLNRLSRLILDTIRKHIDPNKYPRWTISPDGPLWGIPWEALVLSRQGNKYVYAVEKIRFRYVLSGRDLVKKTEKAAEGDPWILADPDFDRVPPGTGWRLSSSVLAEARQYVRRAGQLKFAQAEGNEVRDCLKSYFLEGKPYVQDRKSTKEALLKLSAPPRILYLSTHGFSPLNTRNLPVDEPLLCCGVALAGFNYIPASKGKIEQSLPGLLTGAEVVAVNLRGTELVVLSACQTGKGETQYGQSPADLRHAFHLAGARAVVATLWSVDDPSTKDIMVPFMQALARRKLADRSAALGDAQRKKIDELRKSDDHHSHPFFWAGLTLSGS
jgi:CHAT domain-containing protein